MEAATWPFGPPLRFSAVDGHLETPPGYWSENRGAWGCYQSHLRALEHAIEHGFERILVLEDDAVCYEDLPEQVRRFTAQLPHDWKLIFLGTSTSRSPLDDPSSEMRMPFKSPQPFAKSKPGGNGPTAGTKYPSYHGYPNPYRKFGK